MCVVLITRGGFVVRGCLLLLVVEGRGLIFGDVKKVEAAAAAAGLTFGDSQPRVAYDRLTNVTWSAVLTAAPGFLPVLLSKMGMGVS